jgi:hypothetical protein
MDRAEEQMTPDKLLSIARRFFIAGFCCLPGAWFVSAAFFRRYYGAPGTPEQVRQLVLLGLGLGVITVAAWIIWFSLWIAHIRESAGLAGDAFSVIVPRGE